MIFRDPGTASKMSSERQKAKMREHAPFVFDQDFRDEHAHCGTGHNGERVEMRSTKHFICQRPRPHPAPAALAACPVRNANNTHEWRGEKARLSGLLRSLSDTQSGINGRAAHAEVATQSPNADDVCAPEQSSEQCCCASRKHDGSD